MSKYIKVSDLLIDFLLIGDLFKKITFRFKNFQDGLISKNSKMGMFWRSTEHSRRISDSLML